MKVKELKEFLKDIDDDVEIVCYQENYDNHDCMNYPGYLLMKEENIYYNSELNQIIIGA